MLKKLALPALSALLVTSSLLVPTAAEARRLPKPHVSISVSDATPAENSKVKFRGKVGSNSRGAKVRLQERQGGRWVVVASGRVWKARKYRLATRVDDTARYRVQVLKNKRIRYSTSKAMKLVVEVQEPQEPQEDARLGDKSMVELRSQLGRLMDEYREAHGLEPFAPDGSLHDYARESSEAQSFHDQSVPRNNFDSAPPAFTVRRELVVLTGMPEDVMAHFEATNPEALLGDETHVGIGVSLRDYDTGYWTLDLAVETASIEWDQDSVRQKILEDTNAYRAQHGMPPLILMDGLNTVSQDWAEVMADKRVMDHNPNYSSQYPAGWTRAGENVARGYEPGMVTEGWYNSIGHRENMLKDYTHIGIGYAKDSSKYEQPYYVQNFAKY